MSAEERESEEGEKHTTKPPTHPPPSLLSGTPSDSIAALKLDTGAFLTAHMAATGQAAAGEEPNMLEEEVSDGDEEGDPDAAAAAAHHGAKRKR